MQQYHSRKSLRMEITLYYTWRTVSSWLTYFEIITRLLLATFYAEKVKTIYDINSTKTTDRIVDILHTRLLQQFIYWLITVLIQTFIKTTKACAGFVLSKYATCEDITKLKWLLVLERIHFTIAKLIFKGSLKENVTENLEIQIRTSNRSLRMPNKAILEYGNLQKQQSFYINYANTLITNFRKK